MAKLGAAQRRAITTQVDTQAAGACGPQWALGSCWRLAGGLPQRRAPRPTGKQPEAGTHPAVFAVMVPPLAACFLKELTRSSAAISRWRHMYLQHKGGGWSGRVLPLLHETVH